MQEHRRYIEIGSLKVGARAKELVLQTLEDNRLSYGPLQREFEQEIARVHGCRFGVFSNSGTSALHMAVATLKELHGWQDGDEIIVPAVTFVATANVVVHNRLQPVFVDVDPLYYELDPDKVEAAITPRTRGMIPVHVFGQACDMDALTDLAHRHDLKIIEDACEAMFASYKGTRVGTFGEIACFSTYVAHLIVTGVGGINVTNNPDCATLLRQLMNHGRDAIYLSIDDDDDVSEEELKVIVARRFSFVRLGHSFRLTEMEAAIGMGQLAGWQAMIRHRQENAAFLTRSLARFRDRMQLPAIRPECEHSFMMYPMVLADRAKGELVNFLEGNGVETRDMLPLVNQPVYRRLFGIDEGQFPVAKWINNSGFYIGCHQDLTALDLEYVVELFERYWRGQSTVRSSKATLALFVDEGTGRLDSVIDSIPEEFFSQMVAVDVGADSATLSALEEQGLAVIPGSGKTLAEILCGEGSGIDNDLVVIYPSNGRYDHRDVSRLLLQLERGNDMVIASRFLTGGDRRRDDRTGGYRSVGNRVFSLMANLLFFGSITDSFSGFRAIRRSRLAETRLCKNGLPGNYHLSIHAMKNEWRVTEVPVVEHVKPTRRETARIARSIVPSLTVLLKEWMGRSKA